MDLTQRISPLEEVPEGLLDLNIFRTIGRNEPLTRGFLALGSHLLRGEQIPAREREIVILRVGWRCQSEYEFGQHTAIGLASGLSELEIAAIAEVTDGSWSSEEAALLAMVDELCADEVVSSDTWRQLSAIWTDEQLLELLVLAGYYRLVSGLLNSAGVALETGTARWPSGSTPRLRAPQS